MENATVAGMNDLTLGGKWLCYGIWSSSKAEIEAFFAERRMKREAVNILAAGAEKTEEVKGQKGGPALVKKEFY